MAVLDASVPVRWERRRLDAAGHRVVPSVSLVVPARNEAANLPFTLRFLPPFVREVVLVDGHSTDATVDVAHIVVPEVRVVEQAGRGKGDALRLGFATSSGDAIVAIDADGSMATSELRRFLESLEEGAEFVHGSRFMDGGGSTDLTVLRRLGNRALLGLFNALYGTHFTDLCYGYFAFWRRVLPELAFDADGFEVETVLNAHAVSSGLRVAEVPSFEHARLSGASNLHPTRDGIRVLHAILHEHHAGKAA